MEPILREIIIILIVKINKYTFNLLLLNLNKIKICVKSLLKNNK